MKIYNETKTEILENPDLEKGYLKNDTLITHIPYTAPVEEVYHYETLKEYPNGGKDVKKVIDVAKVEEVLEHDETEDIQVYIPYTENQLKKQADQKRIAELKAYLSSTDYKAIKCGELGLLMSNEYPEDYQKRSEARAEINTLEAELEALTD